MFPTKSKAKFLHPVPKMGQSIYFISYLPYKYPYATCIVDEPYFDDGDWCLNVVNRNGIFSVFWNGEAWELFDGHFSLTYNFEQNA